MARYEKDKREMIRTIQGLQAYQKELRDKLLKSLGEESGFDRLQMTSPGCPPERIEELKRALPGIPDSYTKWVERLNLNGISIGLFEVCPASFNSGGMVANLIEGNEEGVLFVEYGKQYHLYSIATASGWGIFVATASSPYKEGEIIAIDENIYAEEENSEQWIYRAAKDFEEFLLILGNLNQVNREMGEEYGNNYDEAYFEEQKRRLKERLTALHVSEEYHDTWLNHLMY